MWMQEEGANWSLADMYPEKCYWIGIIRTISIRIHESSRSTFPSSISHPSGT